jgi:large subunit ribosomal protein L15
MQLHNLNIKNTSKPQRVGRGGKRGTTSGRGTKGQKSRSGRKLRPAIRDLVIRLPKLRGFRNKPTTNKPCVVNIADLAKAKTLASGKGPVVLDRNALAKIGLVPMNWRGEVKLLGTGEVAFPMILRGLKTSESVKTKIEKAGGKVE